MIQSLLNPDITYESFSPIDDRDRGLDAPLYEMHMGRRTVEIALGRLNNTHVDSGVVYYPIYKVSNLKVTENLGVFEIATSDEMNIGSADGGVDIDELGQPLFFDESVIFETAEEDEGFLEEVEEPDVEAQDTLYIPTKGSPWIARLMASHDYAISDNEGGGDCLFAVIRDGLAKIGRVLTVEEIRAKLAAEATEETFQNYKALSDSVKADKARLVLEISTLQKSHQVLEERAKKDLDIDTKRNLIVEARRLEKAHERLLAERKLNLELVEEYKFMDSITSLEQFKSAVQKCSFWADTWAISTLERVLNIKLVIFAEEAYVQGDLANVLLCGQLNDSQLADAGVFTPDAYILTSFHQAHYQLITHRRRGAFTFAEMPQKVKEMISTKCVERGSGPYSLIPQFKEFKTAEAQETIQETIQGPPQVVFQVYEKSSASAHPGKGVGEKIPHSLRAKYALLHRQKHWRRKISPSWIAPFQLEGQSWQSVDHYEQAQKFRRTAPRFYLEFAQGSNSKLSQSPGMARAAGKGGKFEGKRVLPQGVMADPTVSPSSLADARARATKAKFEAHNTLQEILDLTDGAKILHYERGQPPRPMPELEVQRSSD